MAFRPWFPSGNGGPRWPRRVVPDAVLKFQVQRARCSSFTARHGRTVGLDWRGCETEIRTEFGIRHPQHGTHTPPLARRTTSSPPYDRDAVKVTVSVL